MPKLARTSGSAWLPILIALAALAAIAGAVFAVATMADSPRAPQGTPGLSRAAASASSLTPTHAHPAMRPKTCYDLHAGPYWHHSYDPYTRCMTACPQGATRLCGYEVTLTSVTGPGGKLELKVDQPAGWDLQFRWNSNCHSDSGKNPCINVTWPDSTAGPGGTVLVDSFIAFPSEGGGGAWQSNRHYSIQLDGKVYKRAILVYVNGATPFSGPVLADSSPLRSAAQNGFWYSDSN